MMFFTIFNQVFRKLGSSNILIIDDLISFGLSGSKYIAALPLISGIADLLKL